MSHWVWEWVGVAVVVLEIAVCPVGGAFKILLSVFRHCLELALKVLHKAKGCHYVRSRDLVKKKFVVLCDDVVERACLGQSLDIEFTIAFEHRRSRHQTFQKPPAWLEASSRLLTPRSKQRKFGHKFREGLQDHLILSYLRELEWNHNVLNKRHCAIITHIHTNANVREILCRLFQEVRPSPRVVVVDVVISELSRVLENIFNAFVGSLLEIVLFCSPAKGLYTKSKRTHKFHKNHSQSEPFSWPRGREAEPNLARPRSKKMCLGETKVALPN